MMFTVLRVQPVQKEKVIALQLAFLPRESSRGKQLLWERRKAAGRWEHPPGWGSISGRDSGSQREGRQRVSHACTVTLTSGKKKDQEFKTSLGYMLCWRSVCLHDFEFMILPQPPKG